MIKKTQNKIQRICQNILFLDSKLYLKKILTSHYDFDHLDFTFLGSLSSIYVNVYTETSNLLTKRQETNSPPILKYSP